LIDIEIKNAGDYKFSSVEVKEKSFRFDGIFTPTTDDKPVLMIEVQFQKNEKFYLEFLAEIFLYLNQSEIIEDWKAIAIFAKRSLEPKVPNHVQDLIASDWILRVYLEDWLDRETDSFGIAIVQLILAPRTKTKELTKKLKSKLDQETDSNLRNQVVKFVETVLVYKFPKLSRQEIENMFTLSDLKNTRVYKDAKQEGIEEGVELGKAEMLGRMLNHKFENLSSSLTNQINNLNKTQLESLSEVIFDLENLSQLQDWFEVNS